MLKAGQKAPDFTATTTQGKPFTLSAEAKDRRVVLYFFPKAFTSG